MRKRSQMWHNTNLMNEDSDVWEIFLQGQTDTILEFKIGPVLGKVHFLIIIFMIKYMVSILLFHVLGLQSLQQFFMA